MRFRLAAGKQILHHHSLEGREIAPLIRSLELNEGVVLFLKHHQLRDLLLANLDVSAHRKIDEDRRDVAPISAVIDQRPYLRRSHAFGRFVHGSYRFSRLRISSSRPPQEEHHDERKYRQKDDGIAAKKPKR